MNASISAGAAARRPAGRPGVLAAVLLAALLATPPAAAQDAPAETLTGRVTRDGEGVPGVAVELHRVARESSGEIGRTETGADGGFHFALPAATEGTFTVLFATATVDGVRYFGPALHPGQDARGYEIATFDTTSAPEAVDSLRVARRDVILVPGLRGGWEVAEVVRVENPLGRTVVGPESRPVFGFALPEGARDLQSEEPMLGGPEGAEDTGDLVLMGNRVLATVPITPGGRDFFFRYRLPPGTGTLALPSGAAVDTFTVYVREPAPGVRVEGLEAAGPFEADGDRFQRFTGTALAADAVLIVRWSGPGGSPVDPRIAAAVLAGLVLLGSALFAVRRRRAP